MPQKNWTTYYLNNLYVFLRLLMPHKKYILVEQIRFYNPIWKELHPTYISCHHVYNKLGMLLSKLKLCRCFSNFKDTALIMPARVCKLPWFGLMTILLD